MSKFNVRSISSHEGLLLLPLAIFVFALYFNTLDSPFIFDDVGNIQDNPYIRLTKIGFGDIAKAALESPASNRPVANISFALNYYFHKYNIEGYHLVNILIHIATGILLYYFVKATLGIASLRSRYGLYKWIPFLTAGLWIIHPIQTQSVTYIVQRMNSMAAMFYVLSFLLYVKARLAEEKRKKVALFTFCVLTGIIALGSKEIAATLPFYILLYEWFFFQEVSLSWFKRHILLLIVILVLLSITALMFLGAHPLEIILNSYKARDFTLTQRVLTEFRVVIHYVGLLIFPHPSRLNLDYDFPLSYSLFDPITTLFSLGGIFGLIALAIYMAKKEPLLSFCILWFLGNLAIESSVIGLEIIFEHRTYLPSMLVSLMAITLAYQYLKQRRIRVAALCVIVMVYSVWTYERNSVWGDNVTLWTDCVEKSPGKARPHYNLGYALASRENLKEATIQYFEALQIKPDYADAHYNLGNALVKQGRTAEAIEHYTKTLQIDKDYVNAYSNLGYALIDQGKIDEAISQFSRALQIKPDHADVHYNLGNALVKQGRTAEAIAHYTRTLEIDPDYVNAHNNLGSVLIDQGKIEEAIRHFSKVLWIKPDFKEGRINLANALALKGKPVESIEHYTQALRIRPDDAKMHSKLGNALARQGKLKEAVSHFSEALRIEPNDAQTHHSLGNVLASQGNIKEAVGHFLRALQINPDFPDAHNNLGNAFAKQGRTEEAIDHYSKALQVKPDYAEAHNNMGIALVKQGNLKEAVSHYLEALRIEPDYAKAHNNVGIALARQGKFRGAVGHFSEALRIKPGFEGASRNLELVLQLMEKSTGTSDAAPRQ